jgi:uncharacterized protein YqeY
VRKGPDEEEQLLLQETITEAWKTAMKARSSEKDILALMRTELKNKAIATREAGSSTTEVNDEVALGVFQKMAKQRKDSITQYQAGGRDDLVAAEQSELEVIQRYLPQPMSEADIDAVITEVMAQTGTSTMQDMGKVMGPAMGKLKGRADGKQVQARVRALLGG